MARRIAPQQGAKSRLLKMTVMGQGVNDAALAHDFKGNAIRKTPLLVRAVEEQLKAAIEPGGFKRDNLDALIFAHIPDNIPGKGPPAWFAEAVSGFQQYKFAGQPWSAQMIPPGNRPFMQRIILNDQRNQKRCVNECRH
jgi:hypothetical protein